MTDTHDPYNNRCTFCHSPPDLPCTTRLFEEFIAYGSAAAINGARFAIERGFESGIEQGHGIHKIPHEGRGGFSPIRLIWYQRRDGVWNADCACGATCCGVRFVARAEFETWHFEKAKIESAELKARGKEERRACGPKFPEEDINDPRPFIFP